MKATIKINGKEYGLRMMDERVRNCAAICPLGDECEALAYDQFEFCLPLFGWNDHGRRVINRFVLEELSNEG
ncbi:MAG: hypothetical protein LUD72_01075 [Bacteroidales bacterium]|nr:hypothetical protein [Bacteroidales bacterium]